MFRGEPSGALDVTGGGGTGPTTVTGSVGAYQSGPWTVGITGAVSGPVTVTGSVAAFQSGAWTVGVTGAITGPVTVTGTVSAAQSGAWAVTATDNLTQIGGANVLVGGPTGSLSVGGTVANNVAITQNPLNLGAQGVSSENAAVTTGRQVQLVADLNGKLIVLPYANSENFVSATTAAMSGTTSTVTLAAPASGLRNYVTTIIVANAHATVGTNLLLQDGSGGTTLGSIPAAALYGGAVVTFPVPLRQPTTATGFYVQNETTGSSVKATVIGYVGK